jgi:uncharacterized membrane protein YfcA
VTLTPASHAALIRKHRRFRAAALILTAACVAGIIVSTAVETNPIDHAMGVILGVLLAVILFFAAVIEVSLRRAYRITPVDGRQVCLDRDPFAVTLEPTDWND